MKQLSIKLISSLCFCASSFILVSCETLVKNPNQGTAPSNPATFVEPSTSPKAPKLQQLPSQPQGGDLIGGDNCITQNDGSVICPPSDTFPGMDNSNCSDPQHADTYFASTEATSEKAQDNFSQYYDPNFAESGACYLVSYCATPADKDRIIETDIGSLEMSPNLGLFERMLKNVRSPEELRLMQELLKDRLEEVREAELTYLDENTI